MRIDELVPKNKIFEQAAPNVAQIVNYLGNQNPGLKPPSVQNALTQFLNNNPDLARQAAANMNAAPSSNLKVNPGSIFRGILGKALGTVALFVVPWNEPGIGTISPELQIAMDLERELLKTDPKAYLDMVNASVEAMTDEQRQKMEDGDPYWPDPRQSDQYRAAEEASRILSRNTTAFAPEAEPVDIPVTQPNWWPEDIPFDPEAPEGPRRDEPPVLPKEDEPPVIAPPPDVPELPSKDEPPVIIPDVPEPVEVPDTTTPPKEEPKPEPKPEPVEVPDTTTPPKEEPKPEPKPEPVEVPDTTTPPKEEPKPEPEPAPGTAPITPILPATIPSSIKAPGTLTAPDAVTGTEPVARPDAKTRTAGDGRTTRRPGGKLPNFSLGQMKSPLLKLNVPLELNRSLASSSK